MLHPIQLRALAAGSGTCGAADDGSHAPGRRGSGHRPGSLRAEFQRELIAEGAHEGLAAARARGRTGGRRPKLTDSQVKHARQLYAGGEHTADGIASLLGASRQTVYRALETVYRALEPEALGAAGQ